MQEIPLETQHKVMTSLDAYLADLVAAGQFQDEHVDMRDNTAYIYGELGCRQGVWKLL